MTAAAPPLLIYKPGAIARHFDEATEARRIVTADYQKAREELSAMLIQMSASRPPAKRAQ